MSFELFNCDCRELVGELPLVDLILTDAPYNITQNKWDTSIPLKDMWNLIHSCSKENTCTCLFGNEPFSSSLRLSNLGEYKYDIIWDKVIRTNHLNAKKQPLRQYENICVFYEKQPTYNPQMWMGKEESHPHKTSKLNTNCYGKQHVVPVKHTREKYPTNIVKFNARMDECNGQHRVHPTQKPVKLLEYLVKTFTNEGDLVLDFTMGSGSTGVACMNLNRKFIGIELEERYYNIATERIRTAYEKNNVQQKLL